MFLYFLCILKIWYLFNFIILYTLYIYIRHIYYRYIVYNIIDNNISINSATEAHDDDGLPHTLEHLIFLGSEDYPYKGVLDLLANRCLASGTNATTQVDFTYYTMTTAGSEGFLSLMPIYLDHILYPTLKVQNTYYLFNN